MRFPAKKELVILQLLLARGPMYALQMTRGKTGVKLGTAYATVHRMEKLKWVRGWDEQDDEEHPGLARRYYEITDEGKRVLGLARELSDKGQVAKGAKVPGLVPRGRSEKTLAHEVAEILMPALSPTMEESKLVKRLVKEGQAIKLGDIIAEFETENAIIELEASDEGRISKVLVAEGTEGVKANTPIAVVVGWVPLDVTGPDVTLSAKIGELLKAFGGSKEDALRVLRYHVRALEEPVGVSVRKRAVVREARGGRLGAADVREKGTGKRTEVPKGTS